MARQEPTPILRLSRLARTAIPGTLVEVRLRCGTASCGCHRDPERRHGPHLYLKYRTSEGRSTGMYVPRWAEAEVRAAVAAWHETWEVLVQMGECNRERLRTRVRTKPSREKEGR